MQAEKVTPTAADRALELAERIVSRTRNYAVKLRPDDTRAEMIAEALREYGNARYNEAKEAAATRDQLISELAAEPYGGEVWGRSQKLQAYTQRARALTPAPVDRGGE